MHSQSEAWLILVTRGNLSALWVSALTLTKCHFGSWLLHDKTKCTLEMMTVAIAGFVAQCIFVTSDHVVFVEVAPVAHAIVNCGERLAYTFASVPESKQRD